MKNVIALSSLRPGEGGFVCRMETVGSMRRRLRDVGLLEGARVRCVGRSPGGDPAAYEICGAVLALRSADAAQIWLRKEESAW